MKKLLISLSISFLWAASISGAPTEDRIWSSAAGTQLQARAVSFDTGVVQFETSAGKSINVPLDKLVPADQAFLKEHFGVTDSAPTEGGGEGSSVPLLEGGLRFPQGEVVEMVETKEGSHYHIYVPKSLREGRKAPFMLYTRASGGKPFHVERYSEGAEINGWIIATSVESKNAGGFPANHKHSKSCVEDIMASLPVDEERVYFSGDSGGGATAFYNSQRIKSAGIIPLVAYSVDKEYSRKHYCYGIGGAQDYNRYHTAEAVSQHGKKGFHRLTPGKHSSGPDHLLEEGMTWLNGHYLADRRSDRELNNERLDYEAAVISWINRLTETDSNRAHYWCHFLTNDYEITGNHAEVVKQQMANLAKNPLNVRYTEGLLAIDEFSEKFYTRYGKDGSMFNHTTPAIERAVEELREEYTGVPGIEELLKEMALPTAKAN